MKREANHSCSITPHERQVKIGKIEKQVAEILNILGFDKNDPQIKDTPARIAKMYVNELFSGCFCDAPAITTFPNTKKYNQMVFLGEIDVKSMCSHHWMPFVGKAYVAYIPDKTVVGISKLARIVKWYMRRPQIQEELTEQIAGFIQDTLKPLGCAVYIEATHMCMTMRGVNEYSSHMKTSSLKGNFHDADVKNEFFMMIRR